MAIVTHKGYHAPLGVRGIIGRFFRSYESSLHQLFGPKIGRPVPSNQETEPYVFTGAAPQMKKHLGELKPTSPKIYEQLITNEPYEASLEFNRHDWRRDKGRQLPAKVAEMGARTAQHWDKILTDLIVAGTTGKAYDNIAYFGTHTIGSTDFDNDVTATEIPALNVAAPAGPTQSELSRIALGAVSYMAEAKDEEGNPVNGEANQWYLMVPPNMYGELYGSLRSARIAGAESNPLLVQDFEIYPIVNQWLTDDDVIYLFRKGTMMPAFFLQEEEAPFFEMLGPGSEHTMKTEQILFSVKATRAVGYGEFYYSLRMQLS